MYQKLGATGILGVIVLLAGLAVIAWENVVLAAGMALVVAGVGLIASGLVKGLLGQFGLI